MRFVAYSPSGDRRFRDRRIGVVLDDRVADLAPVDDFYDDLDGWRMRAAERSSGEHALTDISLAPPAPRDAKIICAAINYRKHGAESSLPTPAFPNLFARWTSEFNVDGGNIPVPLAEPGGLDWEGELAAIVGRQLTDVDADEASRSLFGYAVANEVSARGAQLQATTLSTGQWALGKNPEASCAIGSFVESADALDPTNLLIETIVNGETMQSDSTAEMVFSIGELLAFASRHVTLRPGDVFLTGTPDGVGFGRNPKVYMTPGATVTVRIQGIGGITNTIVDSRHRG